MMPPRRHFSRWVGEMVCFLDNGTVRVVYDTGRPEFVIRTRGVDPYDDSLYCRPQTAFAAWRVFDVIPFRCTSFWGAASWRFSPTRRPPERSEAKQVSQHRRDRFLNALQGVRGIDKIVGDGAQDVP